MASPFAALDSSEFNALAADVRQRYDELLAKNLNLDLTRGKPSSEQLDFSQDLLSLPGRDDYRTRNGTDVRNYGGLDGIEDIRELWADVLGIDVENLIAGDASSLNIMFDLFLTLLRLARTIHRAPGTPNTPNTLHTV